jgi:hypothetical protein
MLKVRIIDGSIVMGKDVPTLLRRAAGWSELSDADLIKHFSNVILSYTKKRLAPDVNLNDLLGALVESGIFTVISGDYESFSK